MNTIQLQEILQKLRERSESCKGEAHVRDLHPDNIVASIYTTMREFRVDTSMLREVFVNFRDKHALYKFILKRRFDGKMLSLSAKPPFFATMRDDMWAAAEKKLQDD